MDLAIEPPHSRVKPRQRPDRQLQQPCAIVAALHVRPLVDDDAIEIAIVERPGHGGRDGNRRRAAAEHGGQPDVAGEDERRAAPVGAQRHPVREPLLALGRKRTNSAPGGAQRHQRQDDAACRHQDPGQPRRRQEQAGPRRQRGNGEGRSRRHDRRGCRRHRRRRDRYDRCDRERQQRQRQDHGQGHPPQAIARAGAEDAGQPQRRRGHERDGATLPDPVGEYVHRVS